MEISLNRILKKAERCLTQSRRIRKTSTDLTDILKKPEIDIFTLMFEYAQSTPIKPKKKGFVYFIQNDIKIKIGRSMNVHKRLEALRRTYGLGLTLLGIVSETEFSERDLHKKFRKDRIEGEWFYTCPEILAFINEHCELP
jgi:hypothetical protein